MAKSGFGPLQSGLQGLLGDKGVSLFGTTVSASSVVSALRSDLPKLLTPGALSRLATPAFGAGIGLILFIFLTFYMLVSGRELARGALWLVPPDKRAAVTDVLPEAAAIIRRYFLGVIVVVVVTAFAAWLGYGLVLHVKNAVLLCITLGALETVPVIGPIIAAVLIAIAALQLKSLAAMAAMVIYAAALRLGIDDVIAPIVLGRSVTAHPVVVMLAYVLGAVLFGVVGLLLAVPATAVARLCLERLYQGEEAATSLRLFPKRR
jgi:predicted PurR-regulated permease PerM